MSHCCRVTFCRLSIKARRHSPRRKSNKKTAFDQSKYIFIKRLMYHFGIVGLRTPTNLSHSDLFKKFKTVRGCFMNCISKTFMCSVIIFSILHTLVSLEYPTFDKYKLDQQHVSRFQTLYLVIFWFPRNVESVLRIIQSSRLIEVCVYLNALQCY